MKRMPVLFVGHGSPMNAIDDNAWSRGFQKMGGMLPEPKAILSVSAHWYVEVTPRVSVVAGFEQATGVLVNTVPPEDAAVALRTVSIT